MISMIAEPPLCGYCNQGKSDASFVAISMLQWTNTCYNSASAVSQP